MNFINTTIFILSIGITNNQQLMVLVGNNNSDDSAIYDRVRKAKKDAELILQAKHHNFFRVSTYSIPTNFYSHFCFYFISIKN